MFASLTVAESVQWNPQCTLRTYAQWSTSVHLQSPTLPRVILLGSCLHLWTFAGVPNDFQTMAGLSSK